MDKRDAEEIVSNVLDSLIEFASEKLEDEVEHITSDRSLLDLSSYMSRCVIDISEESSRVKGSGEGDGKYLVQEDESSFEDITFPFTENHQDWEDIIDANESYITHWNFYPESSEDLLNLQPKDMCQSWDEDEDKRRIVYWGSRGLMQERYIRTLFREADTPDEARPTLDRVASEELPSGRVPHVTALVASRRLPSGVSSSTLPVSKKRSVDYVEDDEGQDADGSKRSVLKGLKRFVHDKIVKRWVSRKRKTRLKSPQPGNPFS
uniref:Archaeal Lon protease n=1 Tax=Lygus hesperus TaxID=30085 RepID=A0A0A9WRU5_LYGHE